MRIGKRHSKKQIAAILDKYATGVPIGVVTARFSISRSTLYRWRARSAAASGHAERLRRENRLLRRRLDDLAADKALLQRMLRDKW